MFRKVVLSHAVMVLVETYSCYCDGKRKCCFLSNDRRAYSSDTVWVSAADLSTCPESRVPQRRNDEDSKTKRSEFGHLSELKQEM